MGPSESPTFTIIVCHINSTLARNVFTCFAVLAGRIFVQAHEISLLIYARQETIQHVVIYFCLRIVAD
jgi:hypothetical protein